MNDSSNFKVTPAEEKLILRLRQLAKEPVPQSVLVTVNPLQIQRLTYSKIERLESAISADNQEAVCLTKATI